MNRKFVACITTGLFALAPLTACSANPPAAHKASWASFTRITPNSGGVKSLEAYCKLPDPTKMAIKIPLDNATDGIANVTVSLRGKVIVENSAVVIMNGTTGFVISPSFPRADMTGDEVTVEVNNTVTSDTQFIALTADQCRVSK